MTTYQPGSKAPTTGVYWCSVCKTPVAFAKDQDLPECRNKCGRGRWQLVKTSEEPAVPTA